MDLQAEKLELVQPIINTKNPLILKKVEDVFRKEDAGDWWNEMKVEE